jgi:hypothetical protein
MKATAGATGRASAIVDATASTTHEAKIKQHYRIECRDRNGNVKWVEDIDNLVTTVGKNKYLDSTIKTGVSSPTWYLGLKGAGTAVAADTMASHATWSEIYSEYSQATRPAFTPGTIAAGAVDNAAAKAVFSFTGTATVAGAFCVNNSTKNGTTGDLLGVGDFSASRPLVNGDTLSVEFSLTIA